MIPVSKPYMPSIQSITDKLYQIKENGVFTNFGPLHQEMEERLKDFLHVPYMLPITNGTVALQVAIRLLEWEGKKVITTPFSFVATASSLLWEGVEPIFVDIESDTLNIDPKQIEMCLQKNPDVAGILAVHVFGRPCDVVEIEKLAKKYNVKVLYDAAHAFGVTVHGKSIFSYGDLSIASFHATKVFHSVEGGAIFCHDEATYEKAKRLINFGINRQSGEIVEVGINGKMSEFHAAVGLCVLDDFSEIISEREKIVKYYQEHIPAQYQLNFQSLDYQWNYAYFPVLLDSSESVDKYLKVMKAHDIFPRRYFYPSLSEVDCLNVGDCLHGCPIALDISKRIICLPCYVGLEREGLGNIVNHLSELNE